jgi:hypothetical protein
VPTDRPGSGTYRCCPHALPYLRFSCSSSPPAEGRQRMRAVPQPVFGSGSVPTTPAALSDGNHSCREGSAGLFHTHTFTRCHPHPPARVATARSPPIRPTGTRSPGRGDRQGRAVTRANRYSAGPILAGYVLSLSVAARQRPEGRNPHHESTGPSWKGSTPRRATRAGR